MSTTVLDKHPDAIKSFGLDWGTRLSNAADGSADTVATSSWELVSGDVTIDSDTTNGDITVVVLSGGTVDTYARLKNTITMTTSGYTDAYEIQIRVSDDV